MASQILLIQKTERLKTMKIKVKRKSYSAVMRDYKENKKPHRKPIRPNMFFRILMRLISIPDLLATHFKCERVGMERLGKKEPAFFLMNHSSFIDLEIAATLLFPRPFNIVATTDGFIGKDWLMHRIGCIPTRKFVTDTTLVRDMLYAKKTLGDNILMYPEVGYSFDGTATTLPATLGKCAKLIGMPLVFIRTYGAYTRDPLYNNLQRRKVKVSARMEYLFSAEQINSLPDEEIGRAIYERFDFDNFAWQRENKVRVSEPFRADGLNRVLYKCPHCLTEGKMKGEGISLSCTACGVRYTLDEYGALVCENAEARFDHVPDWYRWERSEVRKEVESGLYGTDFPAKILAAPGTKELYDIGHGRFTHTPEGFRLVTDDGELDYTQKSTASYSVNADFNWYELGDIISIGDGECLFYCFPEPKGDIVAKIRLAQEEIYKLEWEKRASKE